MKTIALINQFHSDNIGDKLLNYSLSLALSKFGNNVINLGFAITSEQNIIYKNNTTYNIVKKIKYSIPSIIKYIVRYHYDLLREERRIDWATVDVIIVGGGQLLKHLTAFKYCLVFWYIVSKKHHIPLILYGIGIDNDVNHIEKMIYKKILQEAHYINCRDRTTAILVKQLVGYDVVVTPDIAFTYKIIDAKRNEDYILIMPYSYDLYRKAFGFLKSRDEYYGQILALMEKSISLNQYRIILSATTSSDASECCPFQTFLKRKGFDSYLIESKNVQDIVGLLLKSKFLVSGRMHALILSLLCGVTPIAIPVSEKVKSFKETYMKNKMDIEDIKMEANQGVKLLDGYLKKMLFY